MNTATKSTPKNGNGGAVNTAALSNIDKVAADAAKVTANVPTEPPKVAPRVSHSLLVSSIVAAAGGFKSAINLEVAVCLAVYAQFRGVNLQAKKELYSVYKEAGYQCEVGGTGKDYKTVNRRIGYAGTFFASLPEGKVDEFMGDEQRDTAALQSIVNRLTVEYNFRSMNDVLTASGVTPPSQKREPAKAAAAPTAGPQTPPTAAGPAPAPAEPAKAPTATDQKQIDAAKKRHAKGEPPTERQAVVLSKYGINLDAKTPDEGDKGVINAMVGAAGQREATAVADDWLKLNFAGATIWLPKAMKPEALGDLGIKLMQLSHQMKGTTLDAKVLTEAFAEAAVAAH